MLDSYLSLVSKSGVICISHVRFLNYSQYIIISLSRAARQITSIAGIERKECMWETEIENENI